MKCQAPHHPAMASRIDRLARTELPLGLKASGEHYVGIQPER
jgi:hypothetical protein